MAIHIWCPRASESAVKLRDAIRETGQRCFKSQPGTGESRALFQSFMRRVKRGDVWVGWGPPPCNTVALDLCSAKLNHPSNWYNKRDQLIQLAAQGIPCPEVFDGPGNNRLGRNLYHQEGNDLLSGRGRDYWVQRVNLTAEFRIHVFGGLSIRAGIKRPREAGHHPWIRTYTAGWKIDYSTGKKIKDSRRVMAKRAVAALGLDFGAVDIGVTDRDQMVVLEVNTAPGLDEGPSVEAYKRHILRVAGVRGE